MTAILAHAGGFSWDEGLFIVLPVVVFFVLSLINRKNRAAPPDDEAESADDAGASG